MDNKQVEIKEGGNKTSKIKEVEINLEVQQDENDFGVQCSQEIILCVKGFYDQDVKLG